MSSSTVCTSCGSSNIDYDQARGNAVCEDCGCVLEDNIIVSEVTFAENSGGGSSVIGQFVSSEGNRKNTLGGSFQHAFSSESRQVTLNNGRKKIEYLAAQLHLNQHCIDTAYNFFKMAVSKRLTHGRKSFHVTAACLYIVCRAESTPHILLDFSDVLQVNVYTLGKLYLKLCQELCINVPILDPCIYIQRYAHKLLLADKTHEVSMTALRMVSRMKRDWLAQGRRPSGLCGAALLVAARIHEFNRTMSDVVKVVRMSETTIRKRLHEFEKTPSGQLTIDEFHRIDLEEEADPPCYTSGRMKTRAHQIEELNVQASQYTNEVSSLQREIEDELEKKSRFRKMRQSLAVKLGLDLDSFPNVTDTSNKINNTEHVQNSQQQNIVKTSPESSNNNSGKSQEIPSTSETTQDLPGDPKTTEDSPTQDETEQNLVSQTLVSPTAGVSGDEAGSTIANNTEVALTEPFLEWEMPDVGDSSVTSAIGPGPCAATLGLKESIEQCLTDDNIPEADGTGDLTLEGIDDSEIEMMILSEDEVRSKTILWEKANSDYLQIQKEKAEKEARDRELGILKPEKKRKRAKKKVPQALTAVEAIEKMLQEKRISTKINYDVLRDLNKTTTAIKPAPETSVSDSTPVKLTPRASLNSDKKVIRKTPIKRMNPPASPKSKPTALNAAKRLRKSSSDVVLGAKNSTDQSVIATNTPEPVVEEGPVKFDDHDEAADETNVDEVYDEPLSAVQLLAYHTEVDYGDYDDEM